jgi:hypothetical protein
MDHIIDLVLLIIVVATSPFAGIVAIMGTRKVKAAWNKLESEGDMLSSAVKRNEELSAVQHRKAIAIAHAEAVKAEVGALAVMEAAQTLAPGDLQAHKMLADGKNPAPRYDASIDTAMRSVNFPIPPNEGAGYFAHLASTYRIAHEIDEAAQTIPHAQGAESP